MVRVTDEVRRLRRRFQERGEESQIWDAVLTARYADDRTGAHRPYTLDYVEGLFSDHYELHGDRAFGDDPAIVTGIATYHGRPVVFVGHQKGLNLADRVHRNFGSARPEGYRKAMRAFDLADRLGFPVLTFVDTPGAYPGVGAEERGQAGMIARSILTMARLEVPVICTVIGEGGSGGALALAVGDRILMQENAIYSVISPEGCASILWKDGTQAKKAAHAFRPTAASCLDLGVIDVVVPEPAGGAHKDQERAIRLLDVAISTALAEVDDIPGRDRRLARRARFRNMGVWGTAEPLTEV